jgi:hypothetical protein
MGSAQRSAFGMEGAIAVLPVTLVLAVSNSLVLVLVLVEASQGQPESHLSIL